MLFLHHPENRGYYVKQILIVVKIKASAREK
jgi:hypothetical protein